MGIAQVLKNVESEARHTASSIVNKVERAEDFRDAEADVIVELIRFANYYARMKKSYGIHLKI